MFQYPLQKSFSPGFSDFHSGHYGNSSGKLILPSFPSSIHSRSKDQETYHALFDDICAFPEKFWSYFRIFWMAAFAVFS